MAVELREYCGYSVPSPRMERLRSSKVLLPAFCWSDRGRMMSLLSDCLDELFELVATSTAQSSRVLCPQVLFGAHLKGTKMPCLTLTPKKI